MAPNAPPSAASVPCPNPAFSWPLPPYVNWYPPRMVVFPSPPHGNCQEKPTAGPKLFMSFRITETLRWLVSGPTNCGIVNKDGSQLETIGAPVTLSINPACVPPTEQARGPATAAAPLP